MPLDLPAVLEPHRPAVEAAARPAVRLEPLADNADPAGAAAQYGGRPRVPPGTVWPQGRKGPMSFVGHVDFSQVRTQAGEAAAELPDDGVLAFFGEPDRWPGESRQGDGWVLLFTPRSRDAVPLDAPAPPATRRGALRSLFSRGRPLTGPALPLRASAVTSFPSAEEADALVAIPHDAAAAWEAYTETLLPPEGGDWHQLLGYASWIQGDARPTVEALASGRSPRAAYRGDAAAELQRAALHWRLLWQIDSDRRAGFMWGDAGHLYVLVTEEDLRARRFDRAWLSGDCY